MGRYSTGAWTTDECLRIELSFLLKKKYLIRGKQTAGSLSWNCNGQPSGNISIYCSWPSDPAKRPSIRLLYTTTDRTTGVKEDRDDTVYLEAYPSNLGKGEVLYFICPSSGKRCRILYKAYGCPIWKSRQSYQNRIYYPSQKCSKREYYCERYWALDKQIEKLRTPKRRSKTYRGKPTKRAERLERLADEQCDYDTLMWSPEAMPLGLRRSIYGNIPGFEHLNQKTKRT